MRVDQKERGGLWKSYKKEFVLTSTGSSDLLWEGASRERFSQRLQVPGICPGKGQIRN